MKIVNFLSILIPFVITGCAVSLQQEDKEVPVQQPMLAEEIQLADLQTATGKSIKLLLESDVLKEKDQLKPFVVIGKIDNKFFKNVNTDVIFQDVRIALLTSNKAITSTESAMAEYKKKKAANKTLLPSFDYFLSGEVVKDKFQGPDGEQDCFALIFKLKDLNTKLVIWENNVKLLR